MASDAIAVGALRSLQEHQIAVPDRVSLISFNDTSIAKYVFPALSTVTVYTEEMGKQAIQMLRQTFQGIQPSVPLYGQISHQTDDSRQQSLGGLSLMKTHEILFQTLSQADDYVNGEQLAKELGVSRTSIWKAIQRLEKMGSSSNP